MPATLADIQKKYGEGVYPLYKDQMHEPYMENPNGIGVQGAILYDEAEDKIQCSECGKWYLNIGPHLKFHNLSDTEYRDIYGLSSSIALCSQSYSQKRSDIAKKSRGTMANLDKINSIPYDMRIYMKHKKSPKVELNKVSNKNKFGLCDAQMASRIMIVSYQSGVDVEKINSNIIDKYDSPLRAAICRKYGTWKLASKALGMSFVEKYEQGGYNKLEDVDVLAQLRNFVLKRKIMPTSLNYTNTKTARTHFGSWRRAKMMAGLDQLLEEVKAK